MTHSSSASIDALPGPGQTRAAILKLFSTYVSDLGGNPQHILEQNDIDPFAARDPYNHISSGGLVRTFEYCGTVFNQPLFGLRLATMQNCDLFGPISSLCRSAPDMRTALQCFVDYMPVYQSPEYNFELVEEKDIIELRWHGRKNLYEAYGQLNQHSAMRMMTFFRSLLGLPSAPLFMRMSTRIPTGMAGEFESALSCPVTDGCAVDAIGFSSAILARKLPTSDRLTFSLLHGYMDQAKASGRVSLTQRIEDYVRGAVPRGECTLLLCAEAIGMSGRAIQHNLAKEGLKFSDLVTRERVTSAQRHLAEGRHSVSEIASRLGYSEPASFGRAFKRWTGTYPSAFIREPS